MLRKSFIYNKVFLHNCVALIRCDDIEMTYSQYNLSTVVEPDSVLIDLTDLRWFVVKLSEF